MNARNIMVTWRNKKHANKKKKISRQHFKTFFYFILFFQKMTIHANDLLLFLQKIGFDISP